MVGKFRDRYRIASARLPGWDYGRPGAYFITICTSPRKPFFGAIKNRQMLLSDHGQLASDIWNMIPIQFPFVTLDAMIVMPDHMHGILVIKNEPYQQEVSGYMDTSPNVIRPKSHHRIGGITGQHNPMLHKNISRIIRWFKGRCTFEIRKSFPGFGWQPRFHDRVIRNSKELRGIRTYIRNNPKSYRNN